MRNILSVIRALVILVLGIIIGGGLMFGFINSRNPENASVSIPVSQTERQSDDTAKPSGIFGKTLDEDTVTKVYEKANPGVVRITAVVADRSLTAQPQGGTGTGIILDNKGYILTNNHVIDRAQTVRVALVDGTEFQATIIGRDRGNDLAVVKIDAPSDKLHPLDLGDSSKLKVGQPVVAIGTPFSLDQTVTFGIISSLGRNYSSESGRTIRDVIQTDAAINPGNSGGPLLDTSGKVIGINTAIESPVRGSVGVGFAVPVNTAKLFIPQMTGGLEVKHPWLGISGSPLNENLARELETTVKEGVYVVEVVKDSPAQKGGIRGAFASNSDHSTTGAMPKGGDIILSVDDRKVTKVEEISGYLDTKNIGDKVTLTILRDGKNEQIEVILGEWPERPNPQQ